VRPLLVTSGEPAGIGPDLCLDLVDSVIPVVVLIDKNILLKRAAQLGRMIILQEYVPNEPVICAANHLTIIHISCPSDVIPGQLNADNASYVIDMLSMATDLCLRKEFSGVVTAPVHKGIINEAGMPFSGHTEFFARLCGVDTVVMMLACEVMRVALITTHIPLRSVADEVTQPLIMEVIRCLNSSLQKYFAIKTPKILVAGLNPHAGEGGHLGREEIDVIIPALQTLQSQGVDVDGPFPGDTLFSPYHLKNCDAFVAMYHDQGLAVLKYAGFGNAVNITLGLPIIRTSVDHGTALELVGRGLAQSKSLILAVKVAAQMVKARESVDDN